MARYFIEVSYKGTRYSGFQVQDNAITIQAVVEKALQVFYKQTIALTGSSRTDAGVHALQNFFHFDTDINIVPDRLYNINAILPSDVVIKNIYPVKDDAHSRFLATSREYKYFIYQHKDPFLEDRAWFYPFKLDIKLLQEAAKIVTTYKDFTSFSKRNTQVNNFFCNIEKSQWLETESGLVYNVQANRFLRGMVRGLVGTMLRVGRGVVTLDGFKQIIEAKDCAKADFTTPPHGLFLVSVYYPSDTFIK